MYCCIPHLRTRGSPGDAPAPNMGQLEERLVSYLLDLTEDGVCSLDLPFAQLPQGHLLKVNLRRQGDFFPFESWALSGAMMGEPDQTSPQASRTPKEADTVCWVLLRRPGDLIPQALQPYPQCSGWESVREDSCSLMAEISQTPTPALGLISPTLLKKTQQDSHLIPK